MTAVAIEKVKSSKKQDFFDFLLDNTNRNDNGHIPIAMKEYGTKDGGASALNI